MVNCDPIIRQNKLQAITMHVVSNLQKILSLGCASVHKVRLCSVLDAVNGLLRSRTLSLTAIGRDMSTNGAAKHAIKRVDRLLGNVHLQAELPLFYRAFPYSKIKCTTFFRLF